MKKKAAILMIVMAAWSCSAQDSLRPEWWQLKGYLTNLVLLTYDNTLEPYGVKPEILVDDELLGRIQLDLQPLSWMDVEVSLRNRLMYGESLRENASLPFDLSWSPDRWDLSWTVAEGDALQWRQNIDRALIRLKRGKTELTAGKQRINWSQTFAWNPNDIFNTYSMYDVDYPERPGTDALRLQYFPSATSILEGAVKWENDDRLTYAALYRWNLLGYDFQVLAGRLEETGWLNGQQESDWVAGAGWSGNLGPVAFRGEVSWFEPASGVNDTNSVLEVSAGLDYTFPNSLTLLAEVLYNQGAGASDYSALLAAPMTPKRLSFSESNFLVQASYPFTPLLSTSFTLACFPDISGYYGLASLEYSLHNNLDIACYGQVLRGTVPLPAGEELSLRFSRFVMKLRWSF